MRSHNGRPLGSDRLEPIETATHDEQVPWLEATFSVDLLAFRRSVRNAVRTAFLAFELGRKLLVSTPNEVMWRCFSCCQNSLVPAAKDCSPHSPAHFEHRPLPTCAKLDRTIHKPILVQEPSIVGDGYIFFQTYQTC